jgi:voltage-gated potassium channel
MLFSAFRATLRDPETKILSLAAIAVIGIGSVVYMVVEGWSAVDAVYFCVVTLATVGYGDLHPTTDVGKLFTILYILTGIGIIAAFISELAKHRRLVGREISEADVMMPAAAARSVVEASSPEAASRPAPVVDPVTAPDPSSPRTDIGPGG